MGLEIFLMNLFFLVEGDGLLSISVCMATFNGEKYLVEQLNSILPQLQPTDEVIISDDGSTDGTLAVLKAFSQSDPRIKILYNQRLGVSQNFSCAIQAAQKDIIFLSDQDDIWKPNKVQVILQEFSKDNHIQVIMSDLEVIDAQGNVIEPSYQAYRRCKTGAWYNIWKNTYIGCAMAIRQEFKAIILPFPQNIPMHDMWIGILSDLQKSSKMIPDKLVEYRRHEGNVSNIENQTSLVQKMKWRLWLIFYLIQRKVFKLSSK